MDWKQRIGVLGILLACTSVSFAKSPPVKIAPGQTDFFEYQAGELYEVDNPEEGITEMRAGGDTCATAVEITWPIPGGVFTDTGSTQTAGDQYHTNDCNGDDGRARDLVYKITPTTNALLIVTGCHDQVATAYDARGWVYEGGCPGEPGGPEEPIICSDDGCGEFAGPPNLIFPALAGVTYYIVQDGWQGGRGLYGIQVRTAPDAPNCDRLNACTNGRNFSNTGGLGDRFYIYNTQAPTDPTNPQLCADVGACPDVPMGSATADVDPKECEAGLLFCHGFFCLEATCDLGTAGSPSRLSSDFAGGRGALDNKAFESFWGIDDTIGGVIVWGEDWQLTEEGLIEGGSECNKTEFIVTYYEDDGAGAPGQIVASFAVTSEGDSTGLGFGGSTGTGAIKRWNMVHPPVCLKSGWVSVQGQTNLDQPLCEWMHTTTDLSILPVGRDDNHYWAQIDGEMREFRYRGALMMALAPGGAITGACCDDAGPSCSDNINCAACPETSRFTANTACANIVPLCGRGACCFANGTCNDTLTQAQCTSGGGTSFTGGVSCAADPANPVGVHCPPANDSCTGVTPDNSGLPYQFTGRTDGATTDSGCSAIGPAVWHAFTTSSCQDLIIDYCGTDPRFLGAPFGLLMTSCCDIASAKRSCSIANSARIGSCCIDDPPGYEGNYSVTFNQVPAGTYYYPVRSGAGATGSYAINVEGSACAANPCTTCTVSEVGEAGCSGANDNCAAADALVGGAVCGTVSTTDQDWYTVTTTVASTLTWTVSGDFASDIEIWDGTPGCATLGPALLMASSSACICETAVASVCVPAGTYLLVVKAQAGEPVACGAKYSATFSSVAGCSAGSGACRYHNGTTSVCDAVSTQARCDAIHGHYGGDGSVCGGFAPLDVANECSLPASFPATRVIPTGNVVGTLTYTFNRSELTANPSDPSTAACEPFVQPKDASIWFKWRSGPGAPSPLPSIHLSLKCDDGGVLGDTVISFIRDGDDAGTDLTCTELVTNPTNTVHSCNDESADAGDERAELCPAGIAAITPNRDYFIKIDLKDAGGADEEESFTLYVRSVCSPLTCPAPPICTTPPSCPGGNELTEGEPDCFEDYLDNTNNGCSPGNPFNFQSIACGTTLNPYDVCGETGNYTSNGVGGPAAERDRDWYMFTVTEETNVVWTAQSAGAGANGPGITAQIWRVNSDCTEFTNRDGQSNDDDCAAVVSTATLEPGRYAVTVFGRTVDQDPDPGDQPCGTPYVANLVCNSNNSIAQPADACGSAPLVTGSGRYSGSLNTNGVSYTADGESGCDGEGGDITCCNNVGSLPDNYLRYQAGCTGRVTVDACQSPTPMIISIHTGCPARCSNEIVPENDCTGLGVSCAAFGCGQGGARPTITFDVVENSEYIIRMAPTNSPDLEGPFVVRISECTDPCAGVPTVPAASITTALSRKTCDINLLPEKKSDSRQPGITQLVLGFNTALNAGNYVVSAGGPGGTGVTVQQATCGAPAYVNYAGSLADTTAVASGSTLTITVPAMANARTYRFNMGTDVTTVVGQDLEVRGLVGDANSDGSVNATDRSIVVAAWTAPGYSCATDASTDINVNGATDATDRSLVVAAWTGGASTNCAP